MGILDSFAALISNKPEEKLDRKLTEHIVLGALLSLAARADGQISEAEEKVKRKILTQRGDATRDEQDDILQASKKAIEERLDWQGFTREVNETCDYSERVKLIHDLFAVAWADHELTHSELETIRKISDLLWIEHKDFIDAKLSTKP